jgi:hypothetical protein
MSDLSIFEGANLEACISSPLQLRCGECVEQ